LFKAISGNLTPAQQQQSLQLLEQDTASNLHRSFC